MTSPPERRRWPLALTALILTAAVAGVFLLFIENREPVALVPEPTPTFLPTSTNIPIRPTATSVFFAPTQTPPIQLTLNILDRTSYRTDATVLFTWSAGIPRPNTSTFTLRLSNGTGEVAWETEVNYLSAGNYAYELELVAINLPPDQYVWSVTVDQTTVEGETFLILPSPTATLTSTSTPTVTATSTATPTRWPTVTPTVTTSPTMTFTATSTPAPPPPPTLTPVPTTPPRTPTVPPPPTLTPAQP